MYLQELILIIFIKIVKYSRKKLTVKEKMTT